MVTFDKDLVEEAKRIVSRAVLEGPLKDLTRGVPCPACSGDDGFARLTDEEVQRIGKHAVSRLFRLLWLRDNDPEGYQREVRRSSAQTERWDDRDSAETASSS